MNNRVRATVLFCMLLAGCGKEQQAFYGPPPPPPEFMAVAQRGSNEIALYPLGSFFSKIPYGLVSAAPIETISAPGVDSLSAGGAGLYAGESPDTIAVFDVARNPFKGTFSFTPAASITSGVNDASAFAISVFNGSMCLLVANRGANTIAVYKGLDNVPTGFQDTPSATISGLNAPNGMTFDNKGDLWVSQATDVVEFTQPLTATSVPAVTITSGLQSPSAIAVDWTGTVYVADKAENAIVVYPAGSTSPSLTFTNGIDGPSSLYVNGSLIVANAAGNNLAEYALPLTQSSSPIAKNAVQMNQPAAMAVLQ